MRNVVTCELRAYDKILSKVRVHCGNVHQFCMICNVFLQEYDRDTAMVKIKHAATAKSKIVVALKTDGEMSDQAVSIFRHYFAHVINLAHDIVDYFD